MAAPRRPHRGLVDELLARPGQEATGTSTRARARHGAARGAVRHRQRGADLVFEAYQVDIGGET
jgi:hypothetical protein